MRRLISANRGGQMTALIVIREPLKKQDGYD